ncbi:hypothetical protein [Streptomyces umbrinus]|uniref:hypothetical protein n=1 Tax=Streptomyces umbrinus TaxID=67370 RepID=UPI0033D99C09
MPETIETLVSLVQDEELSLNATVLLLWLKSQTEKGRTRFTQPELTRIINVKRIETLQTAVFELEDTGRLSVDRTVKPHDYQTI